MPDMTLLSVRLTPGGPWVQVPAVIGPPGPQGPRGETLRIEDVYPTLAALREAFPSGNVHMYLVSETNECYVWSATQGDWVSVGEIQGPPCIIESDTPPTDTTKFWRDTTNDTIKFYDAQAEEWKAVGSGGDLSLSVEDGKLCITYEEDA